MPMTSPAATGFRQACHRSASRVLKKCTSASATRNAARVRSVKSGSVTGDEFRIANFELRILNSSFESRNSKFNRMPLKVSPRPLDVGANLIGQLHRRAELSLAANELVKVNAHRIVVDVRVEVEDVALDGDGVVFVQRGAHADVGHALERAVEALETRRGDVDAAAGEELVGRIDVDGGESDLAPQPAAGGDAALDEVSASEGDVGAADGAFGDRVAHDRAGHAHAADAHVVESAHVESESPPRVFQPLQVPLPPRAKAKIASDPHFGHAQRAHQELLDEAVGGPARELVPEG